VLKRFGYGLSVPLSVTAISTVKSLLTGWP
jgi:hypothetical protein